MQVTEKMAKFIDWANAKGQDEITRLINERLAMLKEACRLRNGAHDSDGFVWDALLEPNDSTDQWKGGGDCNKCRRLGYCKKQCRANRLLKQVTTPFLYNLYLEDTPEEMVKETADGMTPDMILEQFGVEDSHIVS